MVCSLRPNFKALVLLLCVGAFAQPLHALDDSVKYIKGVLSKQLMGAGRIIYSSTSDFDGAASAGAYSFRIIDSEEYQDWKTYVSSNRKSTYSSIVVIDKSADASAKNPSMVLGAFETGPISLKFEDRVAAQALSLGIHALTGFSACESEGFLLETYIPAWVRRSAVKSGGDVKAEVVRDTHSAVLRIDFWVVQPGANLTKLKNTEGCFLSARLSFTKSDASAFDFEFSTFRRGPEEAASKKLQLSRYLFSAKRVESIPSLDSIISYDSNIDVTVRDYRGVQKSAFILKAGEPIPFK